MGGRKNSFADIGGALSDTGAGGYGESETDAGEVLDDGDGDRSDDGGGVGDDPDGGAGGPWSDTTGAPREVGGKTEVGGGGGGGGEDDVDDDDGDGDDGEVEIEDARRRAIRAAATVLGVPSAGCFEWART
ncbi:hypothetical protein HK405_001552, partial [Cladochytrium tenue]